MTYPHQYWMAQAIALAKKGLYTTHPNPRVGCVMVKNDICIGQGFHAVAGQPHAEINALNDVAVPQDLSGASVYVTLEPCSHTGKTGPCADALIKAGVARVIFGMQDPNPQVSGRGLQKLRAAGIEVVGPIMEVECRALNPGFIKRMREGLPFVRVKLAMSLDGRTAMASGESQWITGQSARHDVQKWRAQSDAIVTGIGSVLTDNPSMTVRINSQHQSVDPISVRQPLRVIMDSALSILPEAKILTPANQVKIFCLPDLVEQEHVHLLQQKGVDVCFVAAGDDGRVDLLAAMEQLADQGVNEVFVETGAELAGSFLQYGLVDEMIVYVAPKFMGSLARPLLQLPLESMSEAVDLQIDSVRQVGEDLRIILRPVYVDEE